MISYTIAGRLTRDAESTQTRTGLNIEKFSIAVNYAKDATKYFNCSWFGDSARNLHDYLTKGRLVCVVGTPSWREYNGKEYEDIKINTLEFLSGIKTEENRNPDGKPYEMDGKFFDTREELDAYKEQVFESKSPDGMKGPETFDDFDIPF